MAAELCGKKPVGSIRIVLESQRGKIFALGVQFKSLSLADVVFSPLEGYALKVRQHLVCLDAREMFLH